MKYRCISLFLCLGLLLTGCVQDDSGQKDIIEIEFDSMNPTPDLSYEVPLSVPHILVDQVGYTTDGKKTVIFRGNDLPKEFDVINAQTGEVVYSGRIKQKERENTTNDIIGYGDFSDLSEVGTYYIQASVFGRSYDFDIADDIYDGVFEDAIDVLGNIQNKKINVTLPIEQSEQPEIILQGGWITDEEGSQNLILASRVMITVLTAYELYPDSFMSDAEGTDTLETPQILTYLKQQAEWMQALQDEKSGGVYGGIVSDNRQTVTTYSMEGINDNATAAYAAALAKFSYVYKKFDQQYAVQCLKAADRAWKYIYKQQEGYDADRIDLPNEIIFNAAVELYRASGWQTYHTTAKQILENGLDITTSDWATYGAVAYLTTRHSVEKGYCEALMKQLMGRAELISSDARTGAYLTAETAEYSDTDDLLWNMVILSIADYVITNHEYATVIENHQHYFFGCNPDAVCLVNEEGCDSVGEDGIGIRDDLQLNAYHIFMLSQIMNKE